jgi:hypothetical protein
MTRAVVEAAHIINKVNLNIFLLTVKYLNLLSVLRSRSREKWPHFGRTATECLACKGLFLFSIKKITFPVKKKSTFISISENNKAGHPILFSVSDTRSSDTSTPVFDTDTLILFKIPGSDSRYSDTSDTLQNHKNVIFMRKKANPPSPL